MATADRLIRFRGYQQSQIRLEDWRRARKVHYRYDTSDGIPQEMAKKKIIIITLNEYLKQQMYFRHSWRHGCSVYSVQNEKIILMTWAEFA